MSCSLLNIKALSFSLELKNERTIYSKYFVYTGNHSCKQYCRSLYGSIECIDCTEECLSSSAWEII